MKIVHKFILTSLICCFSFFYCCDNQENRSFNKNNYEKVDIYTDSIILITKKFIFYIINIKYKYKYEIIKLICKYINIFHNIHEDGIELIFLTNNISKILNNDIN